MWKTRELSPDYGDLSTPLYKAQSTTTNIYQDYWMNVVGDPASYYYEAKSAATTLVALHDWVESTGGESFFSSEFRKPKFNVCRHRCWQGKCIPYLVGVAPYTGGTTRYVSPYRRLSSPSGTTPESYNTELSSYWPLVDQGPAQRAWHAMQPRFEGEFQGLNFLLELKDFKEIISLATGRTLKKILHQLRRMSQTAASEGLSLSRLGRTLNDIANVGSTALLTDALFIKPLISDYLTFMDQIWNLAGEAQQDFANRGKLRQSSHYTETLYEEDNTVPGINNLYYIRTGDRTKVDYTATLEYRYNYRLRSKWQAIKRYWGLGATPEVIWNGIPFTFLLDYILSIGKAIHMASHDPNVALMPMQYCESLSLTESIGKHLDSSSIELLFAPCMGNTHLATGWEQTDYRRRTRSPNKGLALPLWKVPREGQKRNMFALAKLIFFS
jgi:hypothetical protein